MYEGISHKDWARHLAGGEPSPMNCEHGCHQDHKMDTYYEDCWYCDMCIIDEWWEELSEVLLKAACWTGESDENLLLEQCTVEPSVDSADELTGFVYSTPFNGDGGSGIVSIGELEKMRKENRNETA